MVEIRVGAVLRVGEERCEVVSEDGRHAALAYAGFFPSPRVERVSPGHLVAAATAPGGVQVVVWRWFDAVVLGEEDDLVRLWEPAHGEVLARPRVVRRWTPGTRAYASAGLPGADWWVAASTTSPAEVHRVESGELRDFLMTHDLWDRLS